MHDLLAHTVSPLLGASPLVGLFSSVWPYAIMLLGFSVIVFVHELGHFAAAKWAGVRVERFAVGFGRELVGFTRGETRYSLNMLPLGGYVKMLGQEDFDDKAKELQFKSDPRSFVNKPVLHRMVIVSAGVVMNILFACLLFMVVFLIGMKSIGSRIAFVEQDSPAERAGLIPGDIIRKMNGETILEFRDVMTVVVLTARHESIDFIIERDGELKPFTVEPSYQPPEGTRDTRRQIVGISPGVTREIRGVGREFDTSREDHPRVGDMLVEIDGVEITDDNASELINMLAYTKGDVVVERKNPDDPAAPARRVVVKIPPVLRLYPDDKAGNSVSVLGLAPLARFSFTDPRGRARLAGLEAGDTVLSWDDVAYPSMIDIARAIQECPERDIHFKVRKLDGRSVEGFVRPKRHKRGPATIQASFASMEAAEGVSSGPRTECTIVRPGGRAARAGLSVGDRILSCMGVSNPTMADVNRAIRTNAGRFVPLTVQKADGAARVLSVEPEAPGNIDAAYRFVAHDLLRLGESVATINGKPSPGAVAGLGKGDKITALNGQPVSTWRELVDVLRGTAGTSVEVTVVDADGVQRSTTIAVPHSLRTLLGVGPESRIVSIDGKRKIMIDTPRGMEEVAIGYRKGIKAAVESLDGRTGVTVEYRRNPLSPLETALVDLDTDMADPWVGRIVFVPNIDRAAELTLLKGKNAFDAMWIGLHKTYSFMRQVYTMIERMLFSRSIGVENVSGPLGIISVGGEMARRGLVDFLYFMGIISANLAVINFLPLPILDGGLMVFLFIEKIKGGPVSLKVQIATQMIGLFLIIGVFVIVTFNDVVRIWG